MTLSGQMLPYDVSALLPESFNTLVNPGVPPYSNSVSGLPSVGSTTTSGQSSQQDPQHNPTALPSSLASAAGTAPGLPDTAGRPSAEGSEVNRAGSAQLPTNAERVGHKRSALLIVLTLILALVLSRFARAWARRSGGRRRPPGHAT